MHGSGAQPCVSARDADMQIINIYNLHHEEICGGEVTVESPQFHSWWSKGQDQWRLKRIPVCLSIKWRLLQLSVYWIFFHGQNLRTHTGVFVVYPLYSQSATRKFFLKSTVSVRLLFNLLRTRQVSMYKKLF